MEATVWGVFVARPRHSKLELERVLRQAERLGWRVTGGGDTYFKIYYPCPERHWRAVHLTPGRNHHVRLFRWLERHACWKAGP